MDLFPRAQGHRPKAVAPELEQLEPARKEPIRGKTVDGLADDVEGSVRIGMEAFPSALDAFGDEAVA